jgi:hypothetical protein
VIFTEFGGLCENALSTTTGYCTAPCPLHPCVPTTVQTLAAGTLLTVSVSKSSQKARPPLQPRPALASPPPESAVVAPLSGPCPFDCPLAALDPVDDVELIAPAPLSGTGRLDPELPPVKPEAMLAVDDVELIAPAPLSAAPGGGPALDEVQA